MEEFLKALSLLPPTARTALVMALEFYAAFEKAAADQEKKKNETT